MLVAADFTTRDSCLLHRLRKSNTKYEDVSNSMEEFKVYTFLWGGGVKNAALQICGAFISISFDKKYQHLGNAGNLWSHMTQHVCFSLKCHLLHGPMNYKSDVKRYVCFCFVLLFFLLNCTLLCVCDIETYELNNRVILISVVCRLIHEMFKYVQ